jgi:hypothetical protein
MIRNAFGALLDDRRVLHLTGLCVGFHMLYEGAERGRAALLEAPRQVDHAQAVGQRLLAGWPHRNSRVRPNRVQQHQHCLKSRVHHLAFEPRGTANPAMAADARMLR